MRKTKWPTDPSYITFTDETDENGVTRFLFLLMMFFDDIAGTELLSTLRAPMSDQL